MDGLLRRVPAPLMAEWRAYYAGDPWGGERADWHTALLRAEVRNLFCGRGDTPTAPAKLLPEWGPALPAERPDWRTLKARIGGALAALRTRRPGGHVNR